MNGFVVSAMLCVIFSFITVGYLNIGVWGLIIAQFISQIVYNAWKWPTTACKEMHLSVNEIMCRGTNRVLAMSYEFMKIKK